jgi:hypothetical protein
MAGGPLNLIPSKFSARYESPGAETLVVPSMRVHVYSVLRGLNRARCGDALAEIGQFQN